MHTSILSRMYQSSDKGVTRCRLGTNLHPPVGQGAADGYITKGKTMWLSNRPPRHGWRNPATG